MTVHSGVNLGLQLGTPLGTWRETWDFRRTSRTAETKKALEYPRLFSRAGNRARTGDPQLGNMTLDEAQHAGLRAKQNTR